MNRERRNKYKHVTTPIPGLNRWFSFRLQNKNASKKSLEKESFNKIAQSEAVMNAVNEENDPFRFTSESSNEENNTEAEDEFPSPEKSRYRGSIYSEKEMPPALYHSDESSKLIFEKPQLTSSKMHNSIEDTNSVLSPAKLRKINKRRNFTNSNQDLENEYPQIPVGIDENYVKYTSWKDFINEDTDEIEYVDGIEDIEIPFPAPNVIFANRSDQDITKCPRQRESLGLNKNISSCKGNGNQSQHSQDNFSIKTINTKDIEDDVFKNSNDTRSLMINDAFHCASQEMSSEEHSQIAKEGGILEVPESSTATKRKPKDAVSRLFNGIEKFNAARNFRKKKVFRKRSKQKLSTSPEVIEKLTKKRITELENELQSIPICPLSLTKIPFSRSKKTGVLKCTKPTFNVL